LFLDLRPLVVHSLSSLSHDETKIVKKVIAFLLEFDNLSFNVGTARGRAGFPRFSVVALG
jgi:hypothetical protein